MKINTSRALIIQKEVETALGHWPESREVVNFARDHPNSEAHKVFFVEFDGEGALDDARIHLAERILIVVRVHLKKHTLWPADLSTKAHVSSARVGYGKNRRRVPVGNVGTLPASKEAALRDRFQVGLKDVEYIENMVRRLRTNAVPGGYSDIVEPRAATIIKELSLIRAELLAREERELTKPPPNGKGSPKTTARYRTRERAPVLESP